MKVIIFILCLLVASYSLTIEEYLGKEKISELQNAGYTSQQIVSFAKEQKRQEGIEEKNQKKIEYEAFLVREKKKSQTIDILVALSVLSFIGILIAVYSYLSNKRIKEGKDTSLTIVSNKLKILNKYMLFSIFYTSLGIFVALFPPKFQQKSGENKFNFVLNVDKVDFYFFMYEIISYVLIGSVVYFLFFKEGCNKKRQMTLEEKESEALRNGGV